MFAVWYWTAPDAPVTWKVTDDAPAGTSTDEGTVATAALMLVKLTRIPFAGATPSSDRTTGALPPADTKIGSGEIAVSLGGAIDSVALCFIPLTVAEIAAVVEVATALVLTVKLALSPPCA